nr:protein dj-1 like b [Quercus suber]
MHNCDDDSTSGSRCGCFQLLGFKPQRKRNDNESKYLLQQKGELRESWWKNKLNKVRQISIVSAGPKWKTFVRKFSGFGINKNKKDRNMFQYDPKSYALNFDGGFDCEEDDLVLGFSSRFVAPIHNHEEQPRTGSGSGNVLLDEAANLSYNLIVLPGGLGGAQAFANSEKLMNLLKQQRELVNFF